ncbi:hypothetical protein SBW85_20105 [Vibrio plantisponsor]|uniref:Uncharacterized protein n=1 Tax=Vibrio plantisponsor TaxID=664643 RepID=A0ABU4IN63_9VIBR|nr:hypothetical protein [Vibrio plantisponsor]MDW6020011.1 hypothetical protein [Vibrio plantisponsor]NNM42058.1 hypothetical protein [Vibrio plantisponsor]
MKRYGIISPLLLLSAAMTTHAQASDSQVDIELGCVSVANRDVSIKTGDCNTRRVETVERVKVVKVVEERHYHDHPVHGKHPGKKKGHNKETYILVPAAKHKH